MKLTENRRNLISGTCAGMASLTIVHPFDTIRTRLQTQASKYGSTLQCVRDTARLEGLRAMYSGLLFPLLAQGAYKACMFTSFGFARRACGSEDSLAIKVACGAFAGFVNSFIVTPVELIRNRLMIQTYDGKSGRMYAGPFDAARQIIKGSGYLGLWWGIGHTIMRDVPGCAAWFGTFHLLRSYNANVLFSGGCAGVAFWLVSYPMDSLKSIYQTQTRENSSFAGKTLGRSSIRSLYKGLGISVVRGFVSSGIVFTVQDVVSDFLLR